MNTDQILNLEEPINTVPSIGYVPNSIVEGTGSKTISLPPLCSLDAMLKKAIPLPRQALFLGQAEDGLAVLLNLYDPTPGPILVIGDRGAGKTNFLKVIAASAISTHLPDEIQFGVLSNQPSEWTGLSEDPHCVGIFPASQNQASSFIHTLRTLIDQHRTIQSVLLFIDGLESVEPTDAESPSSLCKILSDGPAHRIWPIATLDPSRSKDINVWLKLFHTQVFGYTQIRRSVLQQIDMPGFELDEIVKGVQFSMKEGDHWIKFWVPILEK